MPTVTALHIYPIKSLGAITLTEAHAVMEGFKYDRRWMLVNTKGEFLTQRTDKRLAKFHCAIDSEHLSVQFDSESIDIPLGEHLSDTTRVKVWSSCLKANEVNPQYSKWFSEILDQECSLVRMTEASHRYKRLFVDPFKTELSFADGYPYLLLGSASMDLLNERCPESIPANRFRANIQLETTEAHEEDTYGRFSLGTATFQVIKPCARCQVITIDQQTGESGHEPTKTLATYRKKKNKINFGANTILIKPGRVGLGDRVERL